MANGSNGGSGSNGEGLRKRGGRTPPPSDGGSGGSGGGVSTVGSKKGGGGNGSGGISVWVWIGFTLVALASIAVMTLRVNVGGGGGGGGGDDGSDAVVVDYSGLETSVRRMKWGEIPLQYWENDYEYPVEVSKRGYPTAMLNTVASGWYANAEWTPDYLSENVRRLRDARQGSSPTFYAMDPRKHAFSSMVGRHDDQFLIRNVSLGRFLSLQDDPAEHWYFSGPMGEEWDNIAADVWPISPFEVQKQANIKVPSYGADTTYANADEDGDGAVDDVGSLTSVAVWFSHPHVTAQCHYDLSYNFHTVVFGEKRIHLFPPEQWANLYLYPYFHHHYHQSQVNLTDIDYERFPNAAKLEGYEITLGKGEVIFIPPFWFHFIEAVELTASVTVLTPSNEEISVGKFFEALPLENNWGYSDKALAAQMIIWRTFERVYGTAGAANQFIRERLWPARYAPLWQDAATGGLEAIGTVGNVLRNSECFRHTRGGDMTKSAKSRRAYETRIDAFLDAHLAADLTWMEAGVVEILLGDMVELLAQWAFGVDNVAVFLHECF